MFTGIVEATGTVAQINASGENITFLLEAPFTRELEVDDSVAHDGVCLTVEEIDGSFYRVTAIAETLRCTSLGDWKVGTVVNLERPMRMNARLDGHIVQGHVDTTATCNAVIPENGSWRIGFTLPSPHGGLMVPKGSICINGVSLTLVHAAPTSFEVAIIPYTWHHTNFHALTPGSVVNLEFDIIGKYVQGLMGRPGAIA